MATRQDKARSKAAGSMKKKGGDAPPPTPEEQMPQGAPPPMPPDAGGGMPPPDMGGGMPPPDMGAGAGGLPPDIMAALGGGAPPGAPGGAGETPDVEGALLSLEAAIATLPPDQQEEVRAHVEAIREITMNAGAEPGAPAGPMENPEAPMEGKLPV